MHRPSMVLLLRLCLLCVMCCTAWRAHGKRELDVYPVFPKLVRNAMHCDVCKYLVTSAYRRVEVFADAARQRERRVYESDALSILEDICNPFVEHGEWIRYIALNLSRRSQAPHGESYLNTLVLSYPTVCRRTCASVRVLCEEILDSSLADTLPLLLLQSYGNQKNGSSGGSKINKPQSLVSSIETILRHVCDPMPECKNAAQIRARFTQVLSSRDGVVLQRDIQADAPREVEEEEMEIERLIDKTQRIDKKRANVLDRDELRRLWSAIERGDRDAAAEIDPTAFSMSEEEFEEMKNEIANMGPPRDWTQTKPSARPVPDSDL